jgi:transcriptional regulator with XRE-family HTH domain
VGDRLRRLRTARGMTQRDLVDSIRTPDGTRHSVGYLSRLERGWSSPPFFTYVAIAETLGAEPGKVFGPDVIEADAAEDTLLRCLRDAGIAPHEAILRLLGDRDPDQQLAPVDRHRIAAVE